MPEPDSACPLDGWRRTAATVDNETGVWCPFCGGFEVIE